MNDEQRQRMRAQTDAVKASIERGMRHVIAEQTNELEQIMASVADAPYFPLIDHGPDGELVLQFLTDEPAVREYYRARHGSYEIVRSRHIAAICTDFYTMRESVATLRGVGDIGGVDGSGQVFSVNSVVLFPTEAGGIGGEIVWTRYPFSDIVADKVNVAPDIDGPVHLPNLRLRNADVIGAYLDAWRQGDASGVAEVLSDDVRLLRRLRRDDATEHVSTAGVSEARDHLAEEFERYVPVAVDVINRLVGDWYAFLDLSVEVRDQVTGRLEHRRHIALHPITDDGRLRAELGDIVVMA